MAFQETWWFGFGEIRSEDSEAVSADGKKSLLVELDVDRDDLNRNLITLTKHLSSEVVGWTV